MNTLMIKNGRILIPGIPIRIPFCFMCKNYLDKLQCEAFPGGIPDKIINGEHDHKNPYKGDNGIQFEPIN